jgi:Ca2+-binding EF-hand superfamily protein
MNRLLNRGAFALTLVLAAGLVVCAQAPPRVAPAPTKPAADKDLPPAEPQTLVYIGETRPILLRLHLMIDGKPYAASWDSFMKKLFDYADVDRNGTLSPKEAALVPSLEVLRIPFQNFIANIDGARSAVSFAELDADKDGKVTFDEFKAYYRKVNFGAFQTRGTEGAGKSGQLTEVLFKALDRNGDGKLSRDEFLNADEVLHRFDSDEDEMISQAELVPDTNPYARVRFAGMNTDVPASPAFQLVASGDPGGMLAKALLMKYDKDKNGKLSRAESGFDEATFARIDLNKDGQLDGGELSKWAAGPSDLELTVRLGGLPPKPRPGGLLGAVVASNGPALDTAVEVTPGKSWPLASAARPQGDGIVFAHGVAQIDVRGDNAGRFTPVNGLRNFYVQQFNNTLKDKKDYITREEANRANFISGLFGLADRDGDGKLTLKEFNNFFDTIGAGSGAFATLSVADHGAGLFELIDSNRDGRLSIRELRTAWDRIAAWDKANAGTVTREQIPRHYQLTLRQGPPEDPRFRPQVLRTGPQMVSGGSAGRGPVWFRKMDRNGDGDVSRREWLGSMEDFKKIDTDGDGLISLQEAEKADVWFREKMREKK